jgi:hypothetical protein
MLEYNQMKFQYFGKILSEIVIKSKEARIAGFFASVS